MILEIAGICFSYGSGNTVDGISFSAGPGDMVSILGPNGAGKTTLMKCIDAIIRPSAGCVSVDGTDILSSDKATAAKLVGYVPQQSNRTGATVFDSVLLGRKPHMGLDVSDRDVRITANIIELMGLAHIQSKPVSEISGGEFQLTQISRALAQQPKVLLLDEPANNLDIRNQYETMHSIQHIVRENGMCAVMINHDINLALRYSNRFVLMRGGRILYAGGPEVITPGTISETYGIDVLVGDIGGHRAVVPKDVPHRLSAETEAFLAGRRTGPGQVGFFDRHADRWDDISPHDGRKLEYIAGLLDIRGGEEVLDVGTGTGVMIPLYLGRIGGGRVTAVDLSANMVRIAESKFPPSERLRYRVADVYDTEERDVYDIAVCYSCFPHFPDPLRAIRIIAGTLKEGGRLIIAHSSSREHINRTHRHGGEEISADLLPPVAVMSELFGACGLRVEFTRDDGEFYIIIGRRIPPRDGGRSRRRPRARDIFINGAKIGPHSD